MWYWLADRAGTYCVRCMHYHPAQGGTAKPARSLHVSGKRPRTSEPVPLPKCPAVRARCGAGAGIRSCRCRQTAGWPNPPAGGAPGARSPAGLQHRRQRRVRHGTRGWHSQEQRAVVVLYNAQDVQHHQGARQHHHRHADQYDLLLGGGVFLAAFLGVARQQGAASPYAHQTDRYDVSGLPPG